MTDQTFSMLHIYLRMGDNKKAKTFWGRFFENSLSHFLVEAGLKAGAHHALLNTASIGFVKGAGGVSYDVSEAPPATLPICIELVAPKATLKTFIKDQASNHNTATHIWIEGIELSHVEEVTN